MRFIVLAIFCASCGTLEVQYDTGDNVDGDVIDKGATVDISALKAVDGDGEVIGDAINVVSEGAAIIATVLHNGILINVNLLSGFVVPVYWNIQYTSEYFDNEECTGNILIRAQVPEELCEGPFPIMGVIGGSDRSGWEETDELYVFGENVEFKGFWSKNSGECLRIEDRKCMVELIPFETKGFKTPITLEER